jgi:hypothetical protein
MTASAQQHLRPTTPRVDSPDGRRSLHRVRKRVPEHTTPNNERVRHRMWSINRHNEISCTRQADAMRQTETRKNGEIDVSHVNFCIQKSKSEPCQCHQAHACYTTLQVRDVIHWTNSLNIPQAHIKRHPDPAPGCHNNRRIHNITIVYVWSDQGPHKSKMYD